MIVLDFETFGRIDLSAAGAWHYASDPASDVLIMAYQIDAGAVGTWVPGQPIPADLQRALDAGQDVLAHNAQFDRAIWECIAQPHYGFPPVKGRWLDSRVLCALAGLPRSLEQAAAALGLEQQKQIDGKRLIKLFSLPHRSGLFEDRARPADHPEDWKRFVEYCRQDVCTTAALVERLRAFFPQLEQDHPCWEVDYQMGRRGVLADLELSEAIAQTAERLMTEIERECRELTGGIAPGQVSALTAWLRERGADFETLGEIEILEAFETDLAPDVRRVLELRLEGSKSAWRKVYAIREAVGPDNRLRNQLVYADTHTYRWTGRGVQPQNLPRPRIKPNVIADAIEVLRHQPDAFELLFSKPIETLSSLMRATLRAPEGSVLARSDFSKIEVVVLAWLANDPTMLGALNRGEDLYRQLSSAIYGVPPEAVTDEQRHTGKGGILGGGYGAGWRAFQESCRKQGLKVEPALAKATITAYRSKYEPIVQFWEDLERAAIRATATGSPQPVGRHLTFTREDRWLLCRLPSGRSLAWFEPRVKRVEKRGGVTPELRFTAIGRNGKPVPNHTFGGRLCENVVSSTARDLLAESLIAAEREGLNPVLTVHDEIVCEGPAGIAEAIGQIMLRRPAWASDLPVGAEWKEALRYGK